MFLFYPFCCPFDAATLSAAERSGTIAVLDVSVVGKGEAEDVLQVTIFKKNFMLLEMNPQKSINNFHFLQMD